MLPLPKILWHEWRACEWPPRRPESSEAMENAEQVASYVKAYEWGGPTSALQLHHLRELSRIIRPGDVVLDLACGPGPLLLELAPLFPHTTFIGADLSEEMLRYLRDRVSERGLSNVTVLHEDIRTLPSIDAASIDVVISTSALHHLPTDADLVQTFRRMRAILKPQGAFYLFDFGRLKTAEARQMFVAEVARLAPPVTAHDYAESLQAAFQVDRVLEVARAELPKPYVASRSAWVDICFFLQTRPRTECAPEPRAYMARVSGALPLSMKMEHQMLRRLRRSQREV
jgi:ubiquinone/menaquinone biosynthesis C-methylase UbiE